MAFVQRVPQLSGMTIQSLVQVEVEIRLALNRCHKEYPASFSPLRLLGK